MCRNIRPLFNFEPNSTDEEIRNASLQYVRKLSGFPKPSKVNEPAFTHAVDEIAVATKKLMGQLITDAKPKDREVEREKAIARSAQRFGDEN